MIVLAPSGSCQLSPDSCKAVSDVGNSFQSCNVRDIDHLSSVQCSETFHREEGEVF